MVDIQNLLKLSPAKETELTFFEKENYYTRFSRSAISENIRQKDSYLNIRIINNHRVGTAQINKFDNESVKVAFKKAFESSNAQKKDETILQMPEKKNYLETNHFDKSTINFDPAHKAQILSEIFKNAKNEIISGTFTNGSSSISIANSNGLFAQHKSTEAKISFTVEIENSSSSWLDESRSVDKLDAKKVYETARDNALKNRNPKELKEGKYDVVLTPYAFQEIIEMFVFYGLATLPYIENRSPMNGKLGKKIASDLFNIKEDPYDNEAGGQSFDYEGWPRSSVILIENGILRDFVHDRRTAPFMKTVSTGHSLGEPNTFGPIPLNPVINGGPNTPEEMIESMDKGLYIRRLHYTNVLNPKELLITGMTRDGVFYVENGKIKHPVLNMRFGDNLFNILSNIKALGPQNVIDFTEGWGKIPWVKIKDFNFSSTTDF